MLERRIGRRVGDEHRLPALNGAAQLGVAIQIHQVVADGGILIRGHEPHRLAAALGEENRAAVEPERLPQLARDRLQDVHEVQRTRDLLEDFDDGEQVLALVLEFGDARGEPLGIRLRGSGGGHGS